MAGVQPISFTSPGYDYAAEQSEIARKQEMAKLLQAQAAAPLDATQSAGGWAIPISPWQGLAKVGQGVASGYAASRAEQGQRDLAARAQKELADVLRRGTQAQTGTPASMSPGSELSPAFENPAVAPDMAKAAEIYMSHPMTAPMGMQLAQQGAQQQQLQAMVEALRKGRQPEGNPMVPGGTGSSVMSGSGGMVPQGAAPQANDPLSGLDPNAVPFLMAQNPQANEMGKLLQASFLEANKPQNVRPEGTVAVPDGRGGYRQAYYSAKVGEGQTRDPSGAASVIPGYLGNQAALGKTPMTQVQNSDQTHSYIPTAQLTQAANSSPIPVAPAQSPAPIPVNASPAGFPKETPAQASTANQRSLDILLKERADQQAKGSVDPELEREISAAQKRAGAPGTPVAQAGPPRFGQTQEEQIKQARQTAGGKAVDEQFAKDYVAFTTGGASDAAKQLGQLQDVVKELGNPQANLTGPLVGRTPDFIKSVTNPQSIAMRERVEEVAQRSLRAILGAQFTEEEGKRLIARAYNPNLSEGENAIRVGRLFTQLQQAFEAKQSAAKYYEQNGTLQGWGGKMPSIADFEPSGQINTGKMGGGAQPLYATNGKDRIVSNDGGKTWNPVR